MKNYYSFVRTLTACVIVSFFAASAWAQTLTVNNANPGELGAKMDAALSGTSFANFSKFEITGKMNPADFQYFKDRSFQLPSNSVLDLSAVQIVDANGANTSVLPDLAFDGFKTNDATPTLILPNSMTSTGFKPFAGFHAQLKAAALEHIGDYGFAWARGLGDFVVPASVKSVGNEAFAYLNAEGNLPGLTSIVFPAGFQTFGSNVLTECTSLKSVTILATTPPACGSTFGSNIGAAVSTNYKPILYVPTESVDAYKAIDKYATTFDIKANISTSIAQTTTQQPVVLFNSNTLFVQQIAAGSIVTVYDVTGKIVKQTKAASDQLQVTSSWMSGIYMVNIQPKSGKTITLKVVKQ